MSRKVRDWSVGDRAFAHWASETSWWYPATIRRIARDAILIDFDDGDQATVSPDQLVPIQITEGSRVFARWMKGQHYFPGKVTSSKNEEIYVHYDDGNEEWTSIAGSGLTAVDRILSTPRRRRVRNRLKWRLPSLSRNGQMTICLECSL